MEFNFKTLTTFLAIITVALSAGFFYGWNVSSIPGFKRVPDDIYLESMQSINRAILNPWFFIIFFGPLFLMALSTYFQFKVATDSTLWMFLIATLIYAFGNLVVTMFGNVPLNEMLDKIDLSTLNAENMKGVRALYEDKWNNFNLIRAIASIVAFAILLYATLQSKLEALS